MGIAECNIKHLSYDTEMRPHLRLHLASTISSAVSFLQQVLILRSRILVRTAMRTKNNIDDKTTEDMNSTQSTLFVTLFIESLGYQEMGLNVIARYRLVLLPHVSDCIRKNVHLPSWHTKSNPCNPQSLRYDSIITTLKTVFEDNKDLENIHNNN